MDNSGKKRPQKSSLKIDEYICVGSCYFYFLDSGGEEVKTIHEVLNIRTIG